ncbi:MAG: nodulation protein NfeD [Gammaproteobacteria bacterium]|nr:MAG: nodulation protein NfeD [Gammaproteobacteria bacterium]RLA60954.1 MAG: nodulation protein NfeD [Gammaproteobacteria bacterium]
MSYSKLLSSLLLCGLALLSANSRADAWLIDVEGAIGPAVADHMVRGLEQAQEAGAELVILRIDTPGGLDTSMRQMIKAVLASPIPIIGYVAPSGARAASAGTYLLYATHIAAMAPGTNLGAATPVQLGSPGLPQLPDAKPKQEEGEGGSAPLPGTPMERKIVNDAVAYIQSLAQLRGRNAQWAEQAVREGASLSAVDALEMNVIDIVANSVNELLTQTHGLELELGNAVQTLDNEDLVVYHHPVDWRSEFLAVITDPNIAYVLMLVGIYGLIIEFYNPGFGVPGVVGAVCLLLALYALQVLPISYAGLGLILLGIALMTAEAFAPSFGILGLGGIVAFVVGSIMLMDTELPGYQIALPMIVAFAVFSVGVLVFALGMIMRGRRRAVVTGLDHLFGVQVPVESVTGGVAWVRLDGELWEVACEDSLAPDDTVTVNTIDDLVLQVSKDGRNT